MKGRGWGAMPTLSDSIMVLLAGVECRHENLYEPGQVFRTVMRHGLVTVAVVLLEAATSGLRSFRLRGRRPIAGHRAGPLLGDP